MMTPPEPLAKPLVSFIVPTFDSQAHLPRALQSLTDQTCRDFEVVISDGASLDDTLLVAQELTARLPSLTIDSRPDEGVYDAINRGIALARGEWVLVLGSDDRLHAPDTLATIAAILQATKAGVVYGDVIVMGPSQLGVPAGGRYAGPMPLERLLSANVCQQAMFYRRALFAELGQFNLRYRVWADWDFNLRAAFHAPMQWVDVVVSDYSTSGMSSSSSDAVFGAELPELIRRELAGRPYDRRLWPLQRRLRRQARELQRCGNWSDAWRQWATYAVLIAKRAIPGRQPVTAIVR
jgi:glycosyltransferase involved in cell wall biosynthesis